MSRRCRGGSVGVHASSGIHAPAAPVVQLQSDPPFVDVSVLSAASLPDSGGTWQVFVDVGAGFVPGTTIGADAGNLGASLYDAGVLDMFSAYVVQTGGGVDFLGDSPASNIVTNP